MVISKWCVDGAHDWCANRSHEECNCECQCHAAKREERQRKQDEEHANIKREAFAEAAAWAVEQRQKWQGSPFRETDIAHQAKYDAYDHMADVFKARAKGAGEDQFLGHSPPSALEVAAQEIEARAKGE